MQIESHLKERTLQETLWQSVLECAQQMEISPACAESLRAWIAVGVQRMERQRRLAPEDLATARSNLVKLLDLLKKEAVFLGNPNQLDNSTFQAVRKRLRRQSTFSTFTLWPFWPRSFVLTQ